MELRSTTSFTATVSKSEIIRFLKAEHPENVAIRALPDSGSGVDMTAAGGAVCLRFSKESGRHD